MCHTYKINEIFYSIQGEGSMVGEPAVFVRFSGCNMKCDFCDTNHEEGKEYSVNEVVKAIVDAGNGCDTVIFTGGEPLLQLDQKLIDSLMGKRVCVETNGTVKPKFDEDTVHHITVSPKAKNIVVKKVTDLKIIYPDKLTPFAFAHVPYTNIYIQPKDGPDIEENTKKCIELIKNAPFFRLSVQLHKILKIR